jgi:hypothetical protein
LIVFRFIPEKRPRVNKTCNSTSHLFDEANPHGGADKTNAVKRTAVMRQTEEDTSW